jgi:antitoxin component YwqK of YwqJK toxin-antitoxin module
VNKNINIFERYNGYSLQFVEIMGRFGDFYIGSQGAYPLNYVDDGKSVVFTYNYGTLYECTFKNGLQQGLAHIYTDVNNIIGCLNMYIDVNNIIGSVFYIDGKKHGKQTYFIDDKLSTYYINNFECTYNEYHNYLDGIEKEINILFNKHLSGLLFKMIN